MGIIGRTLDTGQASVCLDAIQEHPGPLSSAAHRLQAGLKDSLQQLPRVVRGHVETRKARAELKRIEKEARRRLAEHEAYKRLQVEQEMQAAFETRFECLSCPHKEECPRHGPYVQHYNNIPLNAFSPKGSPFINHAAACSASPRDEPDGRRSSKRAGDSRGGSAAPEKGSSAYTSSVTKLSNGADALQALTAAIGNMRTVKGDDGSLTPPNSARAAASGGSSSNSHSHSHDRHVSYFSSSGSGSMLSASSSSASSSSSPQAPFLQQGSSFFSAFSTPAAASVSASSAAAVAAANTTKTALPAAVNSAAARTVASATGSTGGGAGAGAGAGAGSAAGAAAAPASDGTSVAFSYKMPLPSSPCAGGIPVGHHHTPSQFLSPRDTAGSGSSSSMTLASTPEEVAAGITAAAAATLAAQRVEQMVAAVADPKAGTATPLPTAVLIQAGNKARVKAANKAIRCVRRSRSVPGSPVATTAHQHTTTSSTPAATARLSSLVTALNLSWEVMNGVAGDAGVDSVSTCAVLNTARSEGGCAKVDEATWANMMSSTHDVTPQVSTNVSPQAQQQQQQQDKASLTREQLQERARELRQQRAKQQVQQAREQLQQARQQLQQAKEEVQLRTPHLPPRRLNKLENQQQEEQQHPEQEEQQQQDNELPQTDKEEQRQQKGEMGETQHTDAPALNTCRSHNTTSTGAGSSSRHTPSPAAPQMTAAAAAMYASVADTVEVALQHGDAAAAKLAAQKQAAAAAAARTALSPEKSGVVRSRKNDRLNTWAAELVDFMVASNRLPPFIPGARKRLMLVYVKRPLRPQQQQQQQQSGPWKNCRKAVAASCRWLERRLTRDGRLLASLHAEVDKL